MNTSRLYRVLAGLTLFGVAFGFVEAAVVIDLRAIYEPLHAKHHPNRGSDDLFPLLTVSDLQAAGSIPLRLLRVELGREAATLVMIAAVALAFARNRREWLAGFIIVFGVWDLAFYANLSLMIAWPASFGTWDLLFLLPVPWTAPVIAPMAVAVGMILAGFAILIRETLGVPARFGFLQVTALGLGIVFLLVSFCWNYQEIIAGNTPSSFDWRIFAVGYLFVSIGFVSACRRIDRGNQRIAISVAP